MVQITEARVIDKETGVERRVRADAYDKALNDKTIRCCPDDNCPARLSHYTDYKQKFYNPVTGEPYELHIAASFRRSPNSPDHAKDCTQVEAHVKRQTIVRARGGEIHASGAEIYNLNILTDHRPAPERKAPSALQESYGRAHDAIDRRTPTARRTLSTGVNNIKGLAALLDETYYAPEQRALKILRTGGRDTTLAAIFIGDPLLAFHEKIEERERQAVGEHVAGGPQLIHFRPIPIAKYRSAHDHTIQGLAAARTMPDGSRQHVSFQLHCGGKAQYDAVCDAIKKGARSFLVYTPEVRLDLMGEGRIRKEEHPVLLHIYAHRAGQIMAWTPPAAQLSLLPVDVKDAPPKPSGP